MKNSDLHAHVILAVFDNENDARATMKRLKKARGPQTFAIKRAAVLRCTSGRSLHFGDSFDRRSGKGAILGCIIGGFIGLLGGTVIVPLAIEARIGAMAAKLRDSGLTEDNLTHFTKTIHPGTSLIVAEIEPDGIGEVEWLLQQAGATVSIHEVRGDGVSSLEACEEVKLNPDDPLSGPTSRATIANP